MANFGLFDKPYIKLGTHQDVCYVCVKDECSTGNKNAYDVAHEHRGRLADKFVFYIRKSGQDTCICFDCFKKLFETIVKAEMPQEVIEEVKVEETIKNKEASTTKTTRKTNKGD